MWMWGEVAFICDRAQCCWRGCSEGSEGSEGQGSESQADQSSQAKLWQQRSKHHPSHLVATGRFLSQRATHGVNPNSPLYSVLYSV